MTRNWFKIEEFLKSDERGLLIMGTNQYEIHGLVMKILNKYYKKVYVLFPINAMDNLIDDAFIGLHKKPKSGKKVKI